MTPDRKEALSISAAVLAAQLLLLPVVSFLAQCSAGVGSFFGEAIRGLGIPIYAAGLAAILSLEYGAALLAVLCVRHYLPPAEQPPARRIATYAVTGFVIGVIGERVRQLGELWIPELLLLLGAPAVAAWLAAAPRRGE